MLPPDIKCFKYDHLPEHLQGASKPFCDLAISMNEKLPESEQKSMGLWKLLEAKDCFVRAGIE